MKTNLPLNHAPPVSTARSTPVDPSVTGLDIPRTYVEVASAVVVLLTVIALIKALTSLVEALRD